MKFTGKSAVLTAITSLLAGLLVVMLPLATWAADPCDRACLEHHVDAYIDAMIAHDPGRLALALDARYTENGQELRFGDGLWNTTSGRGKYRLFVADTDSGEVGFFGTVLENGTPLLIALRLRVDEQLISDYLFRVPMIGNLALLLVVSLLFIAANLGVGLTFSTLARNQLQSVQMAFFFFLPSILLSGFMFPFRGMPVWAQYIGETLPLTHFLRIVRGILLKGNSIQQILPNLWPIAIFLVVALTVGLTRYRRTLD